MSDASFNKEDFDRIFGIPKDEIRENYPMVRNAGRVGYSKAHHTFGNSKGTR